ncbi:hypothetical protein GCM10011501_18680 [Thalassotalea profundi]|uniref:BioF2-like acetyltransferase domain-containing protein n=1 Tax=Thalassotalea profundi TaxID=2036687 RepID=A0ABQ3IP52_9GAMM|nr:hypothetical protein GCM10011501_18680 [Thalassotalea profundi]
MNTWIDIFSCSKDPLYIHIWRYNQEIIGIIPCYLKSTFAGNELRFIGTGEPVKSEVCSEFQDFLLKSEFAEKILAQFTEIVMEDNNISAITFNNVLTTSTAYKWLTKLNISGWIRVINNLGMRYVIPVKQEQTEQLLSFKSKNIKRHAKKVLTDNHWRIVTINETALLDSFYPLLIKEHNNTWRKRGKLGAFENSDFVAFHRNYSAAILVNNKLVAFKIETETEISALFYGVIDGDTLYYYQSAINHDSKLPSAGVAMHLVALDIAREHNLAFYDLMKGNNHSYKSRYTTSDINVVNATFYRKKYKYMQFLSKIKNKIFNKLKVKV